VPQVLAEMADGHRARCHVATGVLKELAHA